MTVPVYDNHLHLSPSGRNVEAAKEYKAAGGTGLTLVTLPYPEVPITNGDDFVKSFGITLSMAERVRDTGLTVNVAVGPYPIQLMWLAESVGIEHAEKIMCQGMEIAADMVSKGKAAAIGEIGRPHFPVGSEIMESSNRILLYGMELAASVSCPVIIHCESGTVGTNENLSSMAKTAGLDPGMVVKHSSPALITESETFGVMPSIPSSRKIIREALSKGTRFMLETDYIDDPARPQSFMPVTTVPKRVKGLMESGELSAETVHRICGDIPDSLYGR